MVITIQIWFGLIRFQKYFCMCGVGEIHAAERREMEKKSAGEKNTHQTAVSRHSGGPPLRSHSTWVLFHTQSVQTTEKLCINSGL